MRRRRLAAVLLLAAACTSSDESALGKAESAMRDLERGRLRLDLEGGDAGFRVEGVFSDAGEEVPVLDFLFTELAGNDKRVARIASDGTTVIVAADGVVQELADRDVEGLRLGEDEGFADLGIGSWVEDGEEDRRGERTIVSGRVDAADLLADIARLAAQVTGGGEVEPLDDDTAEELAGLVRSSAIEVEIDEDDLPRSIDATIDFGADIPDALEDALGPYAATTLQLTVSLEALDDELKIELPAATQ